jgi:membrane-bound serine protease (ClpP class)
MPAYSAAGEIFYVTLDGVVNPVMADYLDDVLRKASQKKAEAVVIQLDTPGGLDLSMREMIKDIFASNVPVVVFVAPAGSRAASAGVFITYAASISAMAPGTNIGSAHPVSMGGKMDDVMLKKVENDAVAYIKGIATKRGRNAEWAEKAVRESVNVTAEEALKLDVIDIMATTREELFEKLDGMKAAAASGEVTLSTKGAAVTEMEMSFKYRVLSAISNPNVAYILMIVGMLGIYFELANPGAVLPGVIGAICLVLAFYAFQTLPINYAGFVLIALGVIFFIVELMVVSYGLITIAGIVSILLGSLMLFDSPAPYFNISIWVILPAIILMAAVILGAMFYAVKIHRKKPVSGAEELTGAFGVAADDLWRGKEGKVFIEGEYWNAVADEDIEKGGRVAVVEVNGLLLKVKKA